MENKNAAYVIGHIAVKNQEKWTEYCAKVPATLLEWGGELVFRGRQTTVLAGDHAHANTVVIRFPDPEAIQRWYDSPAYQALIPLRKQAADVIIIGYES